MEDTASLLSNLVQTKSIERVLAPIAAQVSHLIIINEAYERGDTSAFPSDLVGNASAVMKSTEGLVAVGRRLGLTDRDQELKLAMPKACDTLSIAGHGLVTASQRCHMENFSRSSRRHLVRTAKDVLEGTLKVLLVTDDAEIRKVTRAANWVLEKLKILTVVKTMDELVAGFKPFTEAIVALTKLADKRQLELLKASQRERLILALADLRKAVPLLSSALQAYVKYNDNLQTQNSQEYGIGQVIECVNEVIDAAENSRHNDFLENSEEPGYFVSKVDQVLDLLSCDKRMDHASLGNEFDSIVEASIRHGMTVAHFSAETHRDLIIKNCQRVLRQRTQLSEQIKTYHDDQNTTDVRANFEEACDALTLEFQDLERHVNNAILLLVIDVFKETTEPMERFVKEALTPVLENSNGKAVLQEEDLEEEIDVFHLHADRMCQVARFVAASSPDAKVVRSIHGCIHQLERLDPELVPATFTCQKSITDKGAIEHLRMLKKEWMSNVQVMTSAIEDLMDKKMFIRISELEISEDVGSCKQSMEYDPRDLTDAVRSLIGKTRQFSKMAATQMGQNTDPIFRNGVKAYLNQLNKVIPAVKSSYQRISAQPKKLELHETFHKRCDVLLKCVTKVKEAMDGKKHPHILSPLRDNVKSVKGFLDFDSGDSDFDLDEENQEKKNKKILERKTAIIQERKEKKIMKAYLAGITDKELAEMMRRLCSAAVSGQKKQVNLLGNDVMSRANHIIEVTNHMTSCSQLQKETLVECASMITELTPQVIDRSIRVADCDVSQVEPMHDAVDKWLKQVSFLEATVDTMIQKWKTVPDKITEAVKTCNETLLTTEVRFIEKHKKLVEGLMETVSKLTVPSDILGREKLECVQEICNEFVNQTTALVTMADLMVKSGNVQDKQEMELLSREWASKVFCMVSVIDDMWVETLVSVRGEAPNQEKREDFIQVQHELKQFRQETIKLKTLAEKTLELSSDVSIQKEKNFLLDQLDQLNAMMDDTADLLTQVQLVSDSPEKLYAPQRMSLLQWEWATKVLKLHQLVDRQTGQYSQIVGNLCQMAESCGAGQFGTDKDSTETSFKKASNDFQDKMIKVKSSTLEALQNARDVQKKSEIRKQLEDLDELTKEIISKTQQMKDEPSEMLSVQVKDLQREWACKVFCLVKGLEKLDGVKTTTIKEVTRLLGAKQDQNKSVTFSKNKPDMGDTSHKKLTTAAVEPSSGVVTELPDKKAIGNFLQNALAKRNANPTPNLSTKATPVQSSAEYLKMKLTPVTRHGTPMKPSGKLSFSTPNGSTPNRSARFIAAAALDLQQEAEQWEDENNAIVRVAREMSQQMQDLAGFTRGEGKIKNKDEMLETCREIAKNGQTIVQFAQIIIKYCVDSKCSQDLSARAEQIPAFSTQLTILANVKAGCQEDRNSDKMLVKNAENLMTAVSKTLKAAEATCVRGLQNPEEGTLDENEAMVLATEWKKKFTRHRLMETSAATTDDLGLRKVDHQAVAPALNHIVNRH